ncbi:MAG: M16 family metallopeptidase [Chloroflexota bacterium]
MFTKRHLDNGIPVVMEQLRNFRSVLVGVWVKVGSRHEAPEKSGVSHFLEHMFFKGTKKRTAADLAIAIDSLGGDLNAFTSRETTAFYVKVLDEYVEKGVDLLADIFLHSTFLEEEIEKEKSVIKEEIKLVEDTPDDYIHDLFSRTVWGDEGLGQPVLGRRETIRAFTREDLLGHVRKYYGLSDTVVACAGNFDTDHVLDLLNHYLGSLRRGSEPRTIPQPFFKGATAVYPKDLSELHMCLGVEGPPFASRDRYAIALLNSILGAGVSSRLFQEIREKKGYAYSIYSFVSAYHDTGFWAVYAGTGKRKATAVVDLIIGEMRGLADTISDDEVRRAKEQIKGNVILGLESTSNRMQSIARQEIYHGRYFSEKEILREIEAVTQTQVKDLCRRLINNGKMSMTLLGPAHEEDFKGAV